MPNNWYHTPNYNQATFVPNDSKPKTNVIESTKRKANIGEKIVIVSLHYASDFFRGDVFTVTKTRDDSVSVKEIEQGVLDWEYEVITKSEEI